MPTGLIGGWTFLPPATADKVADFSQGGHQGTITNAGAYSPAGMVMATNASVNFGDAASFSFDGGSPDDPFSIVAWGELEVGGAQYLAIKHLSAGDNMEYRFRSYTDEKLQLYLGHNDNAGIVIGKVSNSAIIDGAFHQFAATYDGGGAASGIILYVDGSAPAQSESSAGSYTGMTAGTAPLVIDDFAGNGKVLSLLLFNRELSALEIDALFKRGPF